MITTIKPSYMDIISWLDGHPCLLKIVLSKMKLKTFDQYYATRNKYCMSKFYNEYGNVPETFNEPVHSTIAEFWSECNNVLKILVKDRGLRIDKAAIKVTSPETGDEIIVDAIGSLDGKDNSVFKIILSSQFKKKHKVDLVRQRDYLVAAGESISSIHGIVIGAAKGRHGSIDKVTREITELNEKIGRTRNEGWEDLRESFKKALDESSKAIKETTGMKISDMKTSPSACGFCTFHNLVFEVRDESGSLKRVACTGTIQKIA
jgi:hypothetical protein